MIERQLLAMCVGERSASDGFRALPLGVPHRPERRCEAFQSARG